MSVLKNIGIVLLLIAPFYLWSTYNSFFEGRPGYIYDPRSDQLYSLVLGPSMYRWKRNLLPFSSPRFSKISYVERQTSLTEKLARQNRPHDPEPWAREWKQLIQEARTSRGRGIEFIDAKYWARRDLEPDAMLPPQWRRLPEELEDLDRSVIPADVVISRWTPESNGPIDLEILRGVLFLTDDAAYTVNSYCFLYSQVQWEECANRE